MVNLLFGAEPQTLQVTADGVNPTSVAVRTTWSPQNGATIIVLTLPLNNSVASFDTAEVLFKAT